MIKKAIIGGGVLLLLGLLFFGRDAVSYIGTSAGCLKDSVKDSVPVDFQIQRARGMIKNLVPEVRKNMHTIAREEVEVARLQEQISRSEARLAKEKEGLLRLKTDLGTGEAAFQYVGRKYTAQQVRNDLARRFERYKTGEATLSSLEEIHRARQKSLDAARQKLEGMLASRRQLQVEVENLEARVQMIAAAKTTSDFNFDDSKLGRVKELVQDLRTRLDVAERLVNAEGYFHEEIPLDEAAPENIADQITSYFTEDRPTVETVVAD